MNWQALLQGSARDPRDPATQALAGVLAHALQRNAPGDLDNRAAVDAAACLILRLLPV